MATKFNFSLGEAIANQDAGAIIALLDSRNYGCTSLNINVYYDLLYCSTKNQEEVANAVFRFLLLPTVKGNYPLMKLAEIESKKMDHFHFVNILDAIDCVAWSHRAEIECMLCSIETKELDTLDFLLKFAGDELAGVIYAYNFDEKTILPTDVRDTITLFAVDLEFDGRCIPFLEDHNYTLGEIEKLDNFSSNRIVSGLGLFMLLFNKSHIPCDDYTPPEPGIQSAFSLMLYLRYLYEKGVPPREWQFIRELCEPFRAPWIISVLAIKVFSTYYPGNTKQILQYLDGIFYVLDMELDSHRTKAFLRACLHNREEGLSYAAYLALKLKRSGACEYYDIMLELFGRLDELENPDFIKQALEEALRLRYPDRAFISALSETISTASSVDAGSKFYIKCLGSNTIAILETEENVTMYGVDGIYGYPTKLSKYKVVGFYGSVYGAKKYFILNTKNRQPQELKTNDILDFDGNSVFYYRLEDVAKAPLD